MSSITLIIGLLSLSVMVASLVVLICRSTSDCSEPTRRLLAAMPPTDQALVEQNLGVEDEHPMMLAMRAVIRSRLHIAVEGAASAKRGDVKEGYYDGAIAFAIDLEEDFLRLAEEGRRRKAQSKKA